MGRTTVLIDAPILEDLREIAQREGRPLRKVICELLAAEIQNRKKGKNLKLPRLKWNSQRMGPRIDYSDKEELYRILDERK